MSRQQHILLVRLSSVGDVILATPVARKLRRENPDARISWLVDSPFVELVEHNPHVDRVVAFDHRVAHRGRRGLRLLADQIGPVDRMVDLQNKLRTVMLASLIRPGSRQVLTKRKGLQVFKALMGRDSVLEAPHQVERFLRVLDGREPSPDRSTPDLAGDLLPVLRLKEGQLERIRVELDREQSATPLIGLIPGARHATKRWPLRHMAAVGDACLRRGYDVLVLGGLGDTERVRDLGELMSVKPKSATSRGSLARLAGLLAACDVVISPDSGPAHMAAALGVFTLVVFGPTSPARWAPVGPGVRVIRLDLACSPCSNYGSAECPEKHHACLVELKPDRVIRAVEQLMPGAKKGE